MAKKQPEPAARSFRIRDDAQRDGQPVAGVAYADGVRLAAGHVYTTTDEHVAARLAADPVLEEVEKP